MKNGRRERRTLLYHAQNLDMPVIEIKEVFPGTDPLAAPISQNIRVADRIVVRVEPDTSVHQLNTLAASLGGHLGPRIATIGIYTVQLDGHYSVDEAIEKINAGPHDFIKDAGPDNVISVLNTPNDPDYPQQWDMNNSSDTDINAPQAWNFGTGKRTILAAVTDTGIDYKHSDLYLNVAINQGEIPAALRASLVDVDGDGRITFVDLNAPANAAFVTDRNGNGYIDAGDLLADSRWINGKDNDGNGYVNDLVGWNFSANTNDPKDDEGHGTHVSGTIAAIGNNGVGVAGINWNASVLPLKFLDSTGSGSDIAAAMAISYAAAYGGVKVINASWGGAGADPTVCTAVQNAGTSGVVFASAAGNNASNNDTTSFSPADCNSPTNISVAATDSSGHLSSYSNYGASTVKIGAPGDGIISTLWGGGFGSMSGTSMATPHVTGVVALLASLHPEYSAAQLVNAILSQTRPMAGLAGKTSTGGMLDAYKVLSSVPVNNPPDGSNRRGGRAQPCNRYHQSVERVGRRRWGRIESHVYLGHRRDHAGDSIVWGQWHQWRKEHRRYFLDDGRLQFSSHD